MQQEFEIPELQLMETVPELGHKLTGSVTVSTTAPVCTFLCNPLLPVFGAAINYTYKHILLPNHDLP